MTKELLEQYPDICAELADLERAARTPVSDVVSGSSGEYPYTQHAVSIRGLPAVPPEIAERTESLRQQKKEIEDFVDQLTSPRKRRLARCVMKYGRRWNIIRRAMHEDKSADALRMEFERNF